MKLAEALINRSDLQTRLSQLRGRLVRSSKVQEDDTPPEDPKELFKELDEISNQLITIIQRINKTNNETIVDGQETLSDKLVVRDTLIQKQKMIKDLIAESSLVTRRLQRSEIRMVNTFKVSDLQKDLDNLSKQIREIDTKIQELNWLTELL